jgi:hypothetical protein
MDTFCVQNIELFKTETGNAYTLSCCSRSLTDWTEVTDLRCLHPLVYHDWRYLAASTTIKINQSNCSHWVYLVVATYLCSHLGPSSGSLIKHVLRY